ncbi:pyocin S6 family toxin immunity protein [Pseudomonas lutea]
MIFLHLTGFYPEPDPDSSLQFEKDIPLKWD